MINILLLDRIYRRRLRRKINIKNEQGLKLSRAPNTIVRMGKERLDVFTLPINGISIIVSSKV